MIVLAHVDVTYPQGDVGALCDISLTVAQGDFVFLVGPTGAGKSTLLKLLYRDVRPTAGHLTIGGRDVTHLPAREIPALRRTMGIILQDYGLLPQRTVWENVAFACRVLGQGRRETRRRVTAVLEQVGMLGRCDAFPAQLSGGEQQRAAIARALVNAPQVVIADEPTGSLDPQTSEGVMKTLLDANARGATVIVATHDKVSVDRLRRRVIAIRKGRLVRDEPHGFYGEED
jgi:cell division transport system ATP-binding protein